MAKLTKSYNLQIVNPALSQQWHPSKNGNLTPRDVTPHSRTKVWWICHKKHEWKAMINSRAQGSGCPYCSGRFACEDNCLQTLNPELAKQWHPTKNGARTPKDVTEFASWKVWWICDNKHEYETEVYRRSYGRGCPYCSGKDVCQDNCLQVKFPKLSKEWHPTKNGQLTPKDVTTGNNSKVWWICGKGHEWEAVIANRTKGSGCPFCARRFASKDYNLVVINPKLSEQWHPVKNGNLTPNDVLPYSNQKVWWRCKKGHEWQAVVASRSNGRGCPTCSHKVLTKEYNLKVINPDLSAQWHPVKNGNLTPEELFPHSSEMVWWRCEMGHEWQAYVFKRSAGAACPYCTQLKKISA